MTRSDALGGCEGGCESAARHLFSLLDVQLFHDFLCLHGLAGRIRARSGLTEGIQIRCGFQSYIAGSSEKNPKTIQFMIFQHDCLLSFIYYLLIQPKLPVDRLQNTCGLSYQF